MVHAFSLRDIPKTTVMIVAGPTASGKSDWAMNWAENDPSLGNGSVSTGRIINGDSMQMYHGLDILTAMPSAQDQDRIHHDLYGVLSPHKEKYTVSQWMKCVIDSIKHTHDLGQRAWVVGGTGFYLNTLMSGLSPVPHCDPVEKERLRYQYKDATANELRDLLRSADPVCCEKLMDRQRLLHAWVVYQLTGKSLTWWHGQARVAPNLDFFRVLIWPSRERILQRAEKRLHAMIQRGVYDEVEAFCKHPDWETSSLRHAIGLIPIHDMIQGRCSQDYCHQRYLTDTARYVKRQRTWFRQQFSPDFVCDGLDDLNTGVLN